MGVGPGDVQHMTPEAKSVLKKADVIIGQKDCLAPLKPLLRSKELNSAELSPVGRSRLAVERARAGKAVAIVSPGHPGVYAIASTLFGYLRKQKVDVEVEVVPGLTLADYASARLGSPLGQDFAVISLADRATSWNDTRKRLVAALEADFVLVLYNPRGKLGARRIRETLKLTLQYRPKSTPVSLLSRAATPEESLDITTLGKLSLDDITIDTLVIIGSTKTFVYRGKMITPRAYKEGVGY